MLRSVEGVLRDGQVQLPELPSDVRDGTPVIVTFMAPRTIDLRARGIDEAPAAELRGRLTTFVDDWDSPAMDAYDDYDAARGDTAPR